MSSGQQPQSQQQPIISGQPIRNQQTVINNQAILVQSTAVNQQSKQQDKDKDKDKSNGDGDGDGDGDPNGLHAQDGLGDPSKQVKQQAKHIISKNKQYSTTKVRKQSNVLNIYSHNQKLITVDLSPLKLKNQPKIYYKPQILPPSLSLPHPHPSSLQPSPSLPSPASPSPMSTRHKQKWLQQLKNLYTYFCKSKYFIGRNPTFDKIDSKVNYMTVNTFVCFCRKFNIDLELSKIVYVFKCSTNYRSTMSYIQFINALFLIVELHQQQNTTQTNPIKDGKIQQQHQNQPVQDNFNQFNSDNQFMDVNNLHTNQYDGDTKNTESKIQNNITHDQTLQLIKNRKHTIQASTKPQNDPDKIIQTSPPQKKQRLEHKRQRLRKKPLEQPQIKQTNKIQKLISYLSLHTIQDLQHKKQQIQKSYRKNGVNAYENLIQLKPKSQYKFKLLFMNGKNPEEVREEVTMRKNVKDMGKMEEKQRRESQIERKKRKFAEENKLSYSEKKMAAGGYMSPPKTIVSENLKNISSLQSKVVYQGISKQTSVYIMPVTANQIIKPKISQIRHQTQLNTYNNSLDTSISKQKQSNRHQTTSKLTNKETILSQSNNSYLKNYANKNNKNTTNTYKYRNKLQVNKVIRNAKQHLEILEDGNMGMSQAYSKIFDVNVDVNVKRDRGKEGKNKRDGEGDVNGMKSSMRKNGKIVKIRSKMYTQPVQNQSMEDMRNWLQGLSQEDQYLNQINKSQKNKQIKPIKMYNN